MFWPTTAETERSACHERLLLRVSLSFCEVKDCDTMSRCLALMLLLSLLVLLGTAHGGNVRCVCSPSECDEISDSDCPTGSGLVWDPCGCCKLCSRLEFEACGGPDGFHGSCAAGLECVVGQAGTALDRVNLEGTCMREYNTDNT